MAEPYELWIGYHHTLDPVVNLGNETPMQDRSGASALSAEEVADALNGVWAPLEVYLPPMGDQRVCRDTSGRWYVEDRDGGGPWTWEVRGDG